MKKPRKPHVPKLKRPAVPKVLRRKQAVEQRASEAFADVPRITNETVAEHREEVLGSARKYIYPLQHSRRRIVTISASLLITAVVIFLAYCGLALYKFQSTSGFLYGVTQVIPFPIAKAGPSWVSYESYLFELRHYTHYYQTQQQVDFKSTSGKQQLASFKKQALAQVVDDAYVKQLAKTNHVSVSDQQVNDEVSLVQRQNRLGSSQAEFRAVLSEFWGWDEGDFKRELKQQLLQQAVVSKLDTATHARADSALQQLKTGADFGTLAASVSDDAGTKGNGGQYPGLIDQSNRDVAPQVTAALAKLQPGQVSDIINTGYTLEIVKLLDVQGTKFHAAHIQFNFQPINTYTDPLQAKHKTHDYIKV